MDCTTKQGTAVNQNASVTIDVHFDFVCPWCLIGKRNLDAAISRFASLRPDVSVKVRWHSHQLLPDMPVGGVPYQAFYVARLGSAKRGRCTARTGSGGRSRGRRPACVRQDRGDAQHAGSARPRCLGRRPQAPDSSLRR